MFTVFPIKILLCVHFIQNNFYVMYNYIHKYLKGADKVSYNKIY